MWPLSSPLLSFSFLCSLILYVVILWPSSKTERELEATKLDQRDHWDRPVPSYELTTQPGLKCEPPAVDRLSCLILPRGRGIAELLLTHPG